MRRSHPLYGLVFWALLSTYTAWAFALVSEPGETAETRAVAAVGETVVKATFLPWLADPTAFFVAACAFAFVGGLARLTARWVTPESAVQVFGKLLVSVFASALLVLAFWNMLWAQPPLLMALAGAGGWLGNDVIDAIASMLVRTRVNGAAPSGDLK